MRSHLSKNAVVQICQKFELKCEVQALGSGYDHGTYMMIHQQVGFHFTSDYVRDLI